MTEKFYKKADIILNNLKGQIRNANHIDNFAKKVLKTSHNETNDLILFLLELDAIEHWNKMHRLTKTGKAIVEFPGGTEAFKKHIEKQKKESEKLKKIENQKIIDDAKLSKWSKWTYWIPCFKRIFGN